MQWAPGTNLGFSTAAPEQLYLPVDSAADAPNVETQEKDPNSLLNRTRRLTHLKHTEPALAAYAEFVPLFAQPNAYPFVFARASGKSVLLVAFNPSAQVATAKFEFTTQHKGFELIAGRAAAIKDDPAQLQLEIPAQSYAIYRVVPK
jgi:maltose alpha-D-glucosyltransferase/alpha-amylase